jgi:amino-acid N-acetyltransferase
MRTIEKARPEDLPEIVRLLESNGLPTADLETSRPQFVVAREGEALIGVGALQHLEGCVLLRSLATAPSFRGQGVGQLIVAQLEETARTANISQIVLLTQTATPFFEKRGYRVIERDRAPAAAQATQEFRALCPASAQCMAKTL